MFIQKQLMETIEELGKKGIELTFLFSRNFLRLSLLRGTKEIKRWDHTFNEKRLNWLHLYPRSLQIHFLPISFPLFPSRVSRDYRLHTLYYYSFHSRRWFFRKVFRFSCVPMKTSLLEDVFEEYFMDEVGGQGRVHASIKLIFEILQSFLFPILPSYY